MSGWFPPNLTGVQFALTNGATLNAAVTGTALAAPGASLRYRVWAVTFGTYITTDVPGNSRCILTDAASGVAIAEVDQAGFFSEHVLLPGGFRVTANTAINLVVVSSVASIDYQVIPYLTTEAV